MFIGKSFRYADHYSRIINIYFNANPGYDDHFHIYKIVFNLGSFDDYLRVRFTIDKREKHLKVDVIVKCGSYSSINTNNYYLIRCKNEAILAADNFHLALVYYSGYITVNINSEEYAYVRNPCYANNIDIIHAVECNRNQQTMFNQMKFMVQPIIYTCEVRVDSLLKFNKESRFGFDSVEINEFGVSSLDSIVKDFKNFSNFRGDINNSNLIPKFDTGKDDDIVRLYRVKRVESIDNTLICFKVMPPNSSDMSIINQFWLTDSNGVTFEMVIRLVASDTTLEFWIKDEVSHRKDPERIKVESYPKIRETSKILLGYYCLESTLYMTLDTLDVARAENVKPALNLSFGQEIQLRINPTKHLGMLNNEINSKNLIFSAYSNSTLYGSFKPTREKIVLTNKQGELSGEGFTNPEVIYIEDIRNMEEIMRKAPPMINENSTDSPPIVQPTIENLSVKIINKSDKSDFALARFMKGFRLDEDQAKMILFQIGVTLGSTLELNILKNIELEMSIKSKTVRLDVSRCLQIFHNFRYDINLFRMFLKKNSQYILELLREGILIPNNSFVIKYGLDIRFKYLACDFWGLQFIVFNSRRIGASQ
ncbi:minor coat protein [Cordyline virus 4]|uniref:Minor coat protein n=1 Tax=Cordyline virus 4 TaxID=1177753 RepID=M1NWN0_9CLOS|nr:minor coat protein [Cordyline virus 4]AGF73892.1 minor coat protein [Cordyline virus 4]